MFTLKRGRASSDGRGWLWEAGCACLLSLLLAAGRYTLLAGLRFGHVDHVDQAVHMDIWGGLENGPHMVHMVHIPLFEPRG